MGQANLSIVVALYLAIFLNIIALIVMVIRNFTPTKTASPSAWFILVIGILGIVPLAFGWGADSLLMTGIIGRTNIVLLVPNVQVCLILAMATAGLFGLIVLGVCFIPLRPFMRAKQKWAGIVMLVLMEVVLITLAIAFQLHMSWLQRVGMRESF